MILNRPITDHLAQEKVVVSVEFFPPKDEAGGEAILATALEIQAEVKPDFVSITYGAGGSTRERTFRYARLLKDEYNFNVMPHLTCVGSSNAEVIEIVRGYVDAGFCNLMALRGDPPKGESVFRPHPDGPRYGSDLVALLRKNFSGLCIGVGGYPEIHPEALSAEADLKNLKHKVDQGASFITTQLFFDNRQYFDFVKRARAIGISSPILPGLMPIFTAKSARRFCKHIPAKLEAALEEAGEDRFAIEHVCIDWTYQQVVELIEFGVPGVHFYIMNRSAQVIPLIQRLRQTGLIG